MDPNLRGTPRMLFHGFAVGMGECSPSPPPRPLPRWVMWAPGSVARRRFGLSRHPIARLSLPSPRIGGLSADSPSPNSALDFRTRRPTRRRPPPTPRARLTRVRHHPPPVSTRPTSGGAAGASWSVRQPPLPRPRPPASDRGAPPARSRRDRRRVHPARPGPRGWRARARARARARRPRPRQGRPPLRPDGRVGRRGRLKAPTARVGVRVRPAGRHSSPSPPPPPPASHSSASAVCMAAPVARTSSSSVKRGEWRGQTDPLASSRMPRKV